MLLLCSSPLFDYHSDYHWCYFPFGVIINRVVVIFLENIFQCTYVHNSVRYISKNKIAQSSYTSSFSRFCLIILRTGLANWYTVDVSLSLQNSMINTPQQAGHYPVVSDKQA